MEPAVDYQARRWGKAFAWEIEGTTLEAVWLITGDFVRADKWAPSVVESCSLVEGEANSPGCVRKVVVHPSAPGQPSTMAMEKLLDIDHEHHRYSYGILPGGTLPVFCHLDNYISTFQIVPCPSPKKEDASEPVSSHLLVQWDFVCSAVPEKVSEEEANQAVNWLFQTAMNDLRVGVSLSENSIRSITV
ncbi:hypothetical protein KP509_39G040400 [Ceratopteris richardii]|uniref:Uncharacterized protein n=1 Tax=Ceratopteris richardii TaxID=49495 RepID=A0A8T2PZZ1_CERRI|nr:hypothetical protein KP509_39G040400 [Ceratopteris richardii]